MERKWWTLVVVCAATFMLLLDITIVIVALPSIQSELHASFSDMQWVVDAYALTLASVLLTAGSLADRYGHRLLFTVGLIVFTLGSLLCGIAQSPIMLVVSRSAQGIGGAILFATSLALLAQSFHGKERGMVFGIWGAVTGFSAGLGPVLGGVITDAISWRGIFLVNLPVGIAALVVTQWQVDESKTPHASRPDWAGFTTLTAGLVSLVYGLIRAGEIAWSDTGVAICLALAAVFLVAFVAVELRADHPLFDLSLFRIPTFSGGLVAAFALNGSLYAMFLYLVLYLQDDLGYSAMATGSALLLISGTAIFSSIFAGVFSDRAPVRWLIGPGLLLVGVGLLLMTGLDGSSSWTHLIPGFIVAGVGSGIVNPPLASTAVGVVAPQQSGMASGVNTTFREIGIAAGIAVYGSVFASALRQNLNHALASIPSLERHLPGVVTAIQQGNAPLAINAMPAPSQAPLVAAIHASFAGALDVLLVVSAVLALVGAACSGVLIRRQDFVVSHHQPTPAPKEPLSTHRPLTLTAAPPWGARRVKMETIITTKDLRKSFRGRKATVEAVKGVSFEVGRGEIFGFLGPNGAGKTTTLRMLTTLLPIDSGTATVAGSDVAREPKQVRQRIGYVSQAGGADDPSTGWENLILQGRLYGGDLDAVRQRAKELAAVLDLTEFADRKVATYSGGQRRRLDVALGLIHQPDVLFLDEPTTGLDPQNRANLWDHIRAIQEGGSTIFLTTHYLEEADALCDRLTIMDHGSIVAEGTPRELKREVVGDSVVLGLVDDGLVERTRTLLRTEPFVREIGVEDGGLRLYVEDGSAALPELLRLLDREQIALKSINLSEPTLDDVFLRYTGRSLRDTGNSSEVAA